MWPSSRARAGALVVLALACAARTGSAQPAGPDGGSTAGRLLDVPFLPQREDLCGGAAAAMVLRYWGAADAFPDDFASLVTPRAGIAADALTRAVAARGWRGLATRASAAGADGLAWLAGHVDAGRPVIALIGVGPGRYHYVVVLAVTDARVVIHDPADAPFRVWSRPEFDRAWGASGRWALLVLPAEMTAPSADAPADARRGEEGSGATLPASAAASRGRAEAVPCATLVDAMVAEAQAGALAAAARGLVAATAQCPSSAAAWRELAGVRFRQSRWPEAVSHAARAARLDPAEPSGWDLLATSQFLDGQPVAALDSWNRLSRPLVGGIEVGGVRRTRQTVVVERLGVEPNVLLTPDRLRRAQRRLDALPSAAATTLRYEPLDDGRAVLRAGVVERPRVPVHPAALVTTAAHAAIHREWRAAVASPTGSGELWSAGWRWWHARPRVTFALETPVPRTVPGIVTVAALWERATYAAADGARVRQTRRRAGMHVADWATGALRWRAGAAFDRWDDRAFVGLDGALESRLADDRVALAAELSAWLPGGRGDGFTRAGLSVALRSGRAPAPYDWLVSAGAVRAGAGAPFDLWEGAGLGLARAPLLRAHPLLDDGVVTGAVFGRDLAHASAEVERRVIAGAWGGLGLATFADVAWANRRARPGSAWQADAGAGVRLHLPGGAGALRLDVARGLRDRRHAISAGWHRAWPAS